MERITFLAIQFLSIMLLTQDVRSEVTGSFRGALVNPPVCKINDNNQVDVNFGERLGMGKINGVNYRTPLNYKITCEKNTSSTYNKWILNLTLSGTVSTFDEYALATSMDNLAIRIYTRDSLLQPNKSIVIDYNNPPKLEAVPVKNSNGILKEGAFDAWATLQTNYL